LQALKGPVLLGEASSWQPQGVRPAPPARKGRLRDESNLVTLIAQRYLPFAANGKDCGMGTQTKPDRPGASTDATPAPQDVRAGGLARAEDALYLVVAILLAALAVTVLVSGTAAFIRSAHSKGVQTSVTALLNDVLLVLMLVELLHTVRISLRAHQLVPEPFLIVGLIAAIRRVLVITAEQGSVIASQAPSFRLAMVELGLLTILIVALVASLIAFAKFRVAG